MKPQPTNETIDIILDGGDLKVFTGRDKNHYTTGYFKPSYKVGERLYLQELYYVSNLMRFSIEYKYGSDLPNDVIKKAKWKNKLSMPAKYARYFIEIIGVKVERLQDISDEDCLREGIDEICPNRHVVQFGYGESEMCFNAGKDYCRNSIKRCEMSDRKAFAALFDSINGRGTWDSNPFVFCYEFKLVK